MANFRHPLPLNPRTLPSGPNGNAFVPYPVWNAPSPLQDSSFIGAVVIGMPTVSTDSASAGTILRIEAASAGDARRVQICLGSEGSNLFLITDGKLTSQLYHAFGYDVTATCNPELFDLPTAQ